MVAGTNYIVKFQTLDSEPEYLLAAIFEPFGGEAEVTGVESGEQVTEDSPIPTSVTQTLEITVIELPQGVPCVGCFQEDSELNTDLFQSEGILADLADEGIDLAYIQAVSSKSQVVAGTNYVVKYRGFNADWR